MSVPSHAGVTEDDLEMSPVESSLQWFVVTEQDQRSALQILNCSVLGDSEQLVGW
jgi:hypothetical protein